MIRNIIFDLGAVLINLDTEATTRAFKALGLKNFEEIYSQARQNGLFDAFDCGTISPQEFRDGLKKHLPPGTTDAAIDEAWNAMLLDIPEERLQLLDRLRKDYRLFLLSNTNEIHVTRFSADMQKQHGFSDLSGYFERWYYSCRIGMRKPDTEIFEFVLKENHLDPAETLFIDDSKQHIEGAKKVGITTLWLEPGNSILDVNWKEIL